MWLYFLIHKLQMGGDDTHVHASLSCFYLPLKHPLLAWVYELQVTDT